MNNVEVSIDDAIKKILQSPAPILFPDTCSLVDLIRVPYRVNDAKEARSTLNAALHLITASQTDSPNLWLVVPSLVKSEWREHGIGAVKELQQHWSKLTKQVAVLYASAESVNIAPLSSMQELPSKNLESSLFNLSQRFIQNSILLGQNTDCVARALARVVNKEAPARRGSGMKDCAIIEHSIELCSHLRDAGFVESCVFMTSNTKDFCRGGSKTEPKSPLDAQFLSVNLTLATNWQWAGAELGV